MKTGTSLITIIPVLSPSAWSSLLWVREAFCFWMPFYFEFRFWAHLEWQLAIHLVDESSAELTAWSRSPFGRLTEFWLTWFDCSQIACQEISLILISSVTKVDQVVLSKTQITAELQCSCRCSSGEMRTVACHLKTPLQEPGLLRKHSNLNPSKVFKILLLMLTE